MEQHFDEDYFASKGGFEDFDYDALDGEALEAEKRTLKAIEDRERLKAEQNLMVWLERVFGWMIGEYKSNLTKEEIYLLKAIGMRTVSATYVLFPKILGNKTLRELASTVSPSRGSSTIGDQTKAFAVTFNIPAPQQRRTSPKLPKKKKPERSV